LVAQPTMRVAAMAPASAALMRVCLNASIVLLVWSLVA
jgi:hypothetical protein